MFRVKICGITTEQDARVAVEAGADAIGLNFYERSSRYVELPQAKAIAASLPATVLKVGVFVDLPPERIQQCFQEAPLDAIQLHGDQPLSALREYADIPVIWTRRVRTADLPTLAEELEQGMSLGAAPDMLLLDAYSESSYGGTGQPLEWSAIAARRETLRRISLALAGGLTPENVAEAIRVVSPDAVDVASGVESSPGRKDPEEVAAFVSQALSAFADGPDKNQK